MTAVLKWHSFGTENPTAPVAILLHGFMGCGEDWKLVAESIEPPVRCLCPDLPGHGSQRYDTVGAKVRMPELAEALIEWLDTNEIDTSILIGYSMGGRLALYTALQYPQRISSLVLVSASPGLRTAQERNSRLVHDEKLQKELASMGERSNEFETFLRLWYQQPLFSELSKQPLLFESLVQRRMKNSPPALSASLQALSVAAQPNCWNALSKLVMPTLLVVGEKDEKYCRIGEEMIQLLPQGKLETIEGCSHSPHIESPERFMTILKKFLHNLIYS